LSGGLRRRGTCRSGGQILRRHGATRRNFLRGGTSARELVQHLLDARGVASMSLLLVLVVCHEGR
jgi:hypothetical protein